MAEIDLLIKLFDILKDSIKDVQNVNNALLTNQNNIGNYIKGLPMEDIRGILKDHSKSSEDKIDSCTSTVETKSGDIMEAIKGLKEKVGRMILVVIVISSILGVGILVGGIITNATDKTTERIIKQHEKQEDLKFEEIKKEIQRLHQSKSDTE